MAPRSAELWEARESVIGPVGVPVKLSHGRARQLWMVVGMWDRALDIGQFPEQAHHTAAQLFTTPALRAFWELARAGGLRKLAPEQGRPAELPLATLRIVRDCLKILAQLVSPDRTDVWLPSIPQTDLKPAVRPETLGTLYRRLADLAATGPLERDGIALSFEDRTRLLAMVAIVLAAAPRSGELAALRLTDLAPDEQAVGLRRRQQKGPPNRAEKIAELAEVGPASVRAVLWGQRHQVSEATYQRIVAARSTVDPLPEVEWYALGKGAQAAVRRWLDVRRQLIDSGPLQGGQTGLWVTLVPTKAGPPGITLRPQGLTQAFARGMTALNWLMGAEHGWEPMPTRMEQLRRAVTAVPLADRPAHGTEQT
ncbi:hypothetical protein [Streptomyces finlayi]|uniref:hypothetical protein n=1 Tax=Streptomyces finlayi TaxID=67296 RepID=UPI0016754DC8|nr:hypothetical protein [Streptomyces finlayi]